MNRAGTLRLLWDLSEAGRLRQLLLGDEEEAAAAEGGGRRGSRPRVRASPDGRFVLLLRPPPGPAPQLLLLPVGGERAWPPLERAWTTPGRPSPLDALFLAGTGTGTGTGGGPARLVLLWESGRAELWRAEPSGGWGPPHPLHLSPDGGRARLLSATGLGDGLVWCEERPGPGPGPDPFAFRVCTCRLESGPSGVQLGPAQVLLHGCPPFQVLASPRDVFLVPTRATWPGLAHLLLVWCPAQGRVTVASPGRPLVHAQSLTPGPADFGELLLGAPGMLSGGAAQPALTCAITRGRGELLLLSPCGTVRLVRRDGGSRTVCTLAGGAPGPDVPVELRTFGTTLACALGSSLQLVDLGSGRLLERKVLRTDRVHLLEAPAGEEGLRLLSPAGLFQVCWAEDTGHPAPEDLVFEEACGYYQRRSLRDARPTVEDLRRGGVFRAPATLATVLRGWPAPAKLLAALRAELRDYRGLERLKGQVAAGGGGGGGDGAYAKLAEQELGRLLRAEPGPDNLAQLNAVFTALPAAAWAAARHLLQLRMDAAGRLGSPAPRELWKKVLAGRPAGGGVPQNGALPLFELLCRSLGRLKPQWLPPFVQLAQRQQGPALVGGEGPGPPLYRRALAVVERLPGEVAEALEVELLLGSGRPKAVLQAVGQLIRERRWTRVLDAAQRLSPPSPLLRREIFTILLAEFARHRQLDPQLPRLCQLCPPDVSASDILLLLQGHLPPQEAPPAPFPSPGTSPLTLGLLKPLLERAAGPGPPEQPEGLYSDVLGDPTEPPPTPPRGPVPGAPGRPDLPPGTPAGPSLHPADTG
ncbi:Hermansky-Pudlak syndrome 6 protein [Tachyglossus aculeatus]|uniref:Hermansky-Pudlak syndrome 6 protein n=1 Tax=Tachyglossus aculeatus TaxID=9261 RepID=UPI0018F410E4|nr:Hermansky-Pudlak syndrome 6 protein [Tachyglossus aculeatus]